MLKKVFVAFCILCSAAAFNEMNAQTEKTKTVKSDGTVVINTTTIGKKILGYNDITPVEINIKDGKVTSIKALPNDEEPEYFDKVIKSKLLSKWVGLTPAAGATLKVDAVSGATYSSKAVIANVKAGLKYANEHPGNN
jgi:NosR/NirI family nitrous oxide reductase transcriptional regulator